MLKNLFTISLNQKIVSGKDSVGKFDGKHYCIVAAVSSDKVSPKEKQFTLIETSSMFKII